MEDKTENRLKSHENVPLITGGELLPDTLVGDCKIVALLGRGGFAEVYKATAPDGKEVAVKMLCRLDEKSRAHFEMESRILLGIKHPNLPRVFSFGSYGERPYMVMELLGRYERPHSERQIAIFLGKIVSAIQALHAHGYLHRDIKPQNILMRKAGEPIVVGFGLACPISETNVEADVHAIGVLIRTCFEEKMPTLWNDISMKATNPDPAVRYRTVEELGTAIRRRYWKLTAAAVSAAFDIPQWEINDIGDSGLVSIGKYTFCNSTVIDLMPKNAPITDASYSVRCQVIYVAKDEWEWEKRRQTCVWLTNVLKNFMVERYSGFEFEDLIGRYYGGAIGDDVDEQFWSYVQGRMSEADLEEDLDIESVSVQICAEGELRNALISYRTSR